MLASEALAGWSVFARPSMVVKLHGDIWCVQLYHAAKASHKLQRPDGRACTPVLGISDIGSLGAHELALADRKLKELGYDEPYYMALCVRRGYVDKISYDSDRIRRALDNIAQALSLNWPQTPDPAETRNYYYSSESDDGG